MDFDYESDEIVVAYRYGVEENMELLRKSIIWMLGFTEVNY